MRSPRRIFLSQKKMPGPVRESTWPAMTADPVAPGRGLPVYQPATVVVRGTCRVPFGLRPRLMIGAFTPMAGMVSQTGLGVCWTADSETGTTVRPDGTATGDGRAASRKGADEVWATTRPAVPAPAASSPAPSIAADSSRACAPHTPEAQPATPGRRAVRRDGPADRGATSADSGAAPADTGAAPADEGAPPPDRGAAPAGRGAAPPDGGAASP